MLSSMIRTLCVGVVLFESTIVLDLELPSKDVAAVVAVGGTAKGAGTLRLVARPGSSEADSTEMLRLAVAVITASSCEDDVEFPVSTSGLVRKRFKQACSA